MKLKFMAVAMAAIVAVSCVANQGSVESTRKVRCEAAQSVEQMDDSSSYPGKVYASKEVDRAFRVAGVVESIEVKEGDFVQEGALIAKMDSRDYDLQLAATQAEYDAIKGEVDRVVTLFNEQSIAANDYEKAVNGLKQIEAKLASHRNAVSDTELRAPFAGYIQKIYFDRGATISAGMAVVSIVSSAAPEVVINIPANEYVKRAELQSASARCELFPLSTFDLSYIGTTYKANLNQLYEARFRLSPSEAGEVLSPGMSVMVSLNYGGMEAGAVSIPFSAVVQSGGVSKVWIFESGVVTLREVEVGDISTSGRATITRGLQGGEMVVTAGVNSLEEGQSVEPLQQMSDSNVGGIL